MPQTPAPSRKDIANLWKMLSSNEDLVVQQGIEIIVAMGDPGQNAVEMLLEGVSVNARTGEIVRNNRFSGTRETQPRLDGLLLHLLSLAAPGSAAAEVRSQVRKIALTGPVIPTIMGFDGLEEFALILDSLSSRGAVLLLENLSTFGPFPCLTSLKIVADGYEQWRRTLRTLDGLDAPSLTQVLLKNLSLESIAALSGSPRLQRVDLRGNPSLDSINALSASAPSLEALDLSGCEGLKNLLPLEGSRRLKRLHMNNCKRVPSLSPLSSSKELTEVSFTGMASIESLDGLVGPCITTDSTQFGHEELAVYGCKSLTSLAGLPLLDPKITSVKLEHFAALRDLSGLSGNPGLEFLTVTGAALEALPDWQELPSLVSISLGGANGVKGIETLAQTPTISSLTLEDFKQLKALPDAWQAPLGHLTLKRCDVLESLGSLPPTLRSLRIAGCSVLHSLKGVEGLAELSLYLERSDHYPQDMSSLSQVTKLEVTFYPGPDKVFPDALARALAQVPSLHLSVKGPLLSHTSMEDLSALACLTSVRSLDLSECAEGFTDLRWLVGLPELSTLKLRPGSTAADLAGGSAHPTQDKVRKAQVRLCRKYALDLPTHLQPEKKPAASKARRPASSPQDAAAVRKLLKGDANALQQALELIASLDSPGLAEAVLPDLCKGLGRLLASSDPGQVSRALQVVAADMPAEFFDVVTEGVDEEMAYRGDSEAIGRIFKAVKQPDRPLARWALTWLLASAPAQATRAVALRERLKSLDLAMPAGLADPAPPPLHGFKALAEVKLQGLAITDLALLAGVSSIERLELSTCRLLTRLNGLESSRGLKTISVYDSPVLTDLSALAGMASLTAGPEDFYGYPMRPISTARLSDLRFVRGVSSMAGISLKLAAAADTSPFGDASGIKRVSLLLQSWKVDLAPFRHCEHLSVGLENSWGWKEDGSPTKAWNYDLGKLQKLRIEGGSHDLQGLRAPSLEKTHLRWIKVPSLRGLGSCQELHLENVTLMCLEGLEAARVLEMDRCTVGDMQGVENTRIAELDLSNGSYKGLRPLAALESLRSLKLNSETSVASAHELEGCRQIRILGIPGYSGSLAFLSSWSALEQLDLRDSGQLADLDALTGLAALKRIRIRGSALKRDGWPSDLKHLLDSAP
jgi:Leucine-rich repeat (LRR) protein